MSRVSLDTGVLVEYIDLHGPLHREARAVIYSILNGRLLAIIPHPVLAETFYVSLRIYQRLKLADPVKRSRSLVEWLYRSPNFTIAEPSLELAALSGEIKARFGLALTDSYVLAAAKLYRAKALFRRKEREIADHLSQLREEYDITFLEQDTQPG